MKTTVVNGIEIEVRPGESVRQAMRRYASEAKGVWRTIRGRHVFIREGQSVEDALKQDLKGGTSPAKHKPSSDSDNVESMKETLKQLYKGAAEAKNTAVYDDWLRRIRELEAKIAGVSKKITVDRAEKGGFKWSVGNKSGVASTERDAIQAARKASGQ